MSTSGNLEFQCARYKLSILMHSGMSDLSEAMLEEPSPATLGMVL